MINPQPVNDRRSPYSATSNFPQSPANRPTPTLPPNKPEKRFKFRKWKRVFGFTIITLIVAVGTYAFAQYRSLRSNILVAHQGENAAILAYDPSDKNAKLDPALFTKAGDGRFTMVMVGIGGDNHSGGQLTDSIQVISVDTINKKVDITSIPRDLYVNIPGYGRTKINATYEIGEEKKAGNGPVLMRQVVENVLGVKVSNFALIDFSGFKDVVDSLGGIDVTVPKAIYDPAYPAADEVNFAPFSISAGVHHLDGTVALEYARTRHADSDFGRSARQQLIIEAIKKKALSAGVLANPVKLTNLVTALGRHFKTDLTVDQIKALTNIYKDVTHENTTGHVLDTTTDLDLLTSTTDPVAGYIAYPIPGFDKFDLIHQWYIQNNPDPLQAKESPTITVVNSGKATTTQMQTFMTKLKDYGYNAVLSTATAPKSSYSATQVSQTKKGNDKPFSKNYLSSLLGVTISSGSPLSSQSDFEIIYVPSSTSSH